MIFQFGGIALDTDVLVSDTFSGLPRNFVVGNNFNQGIGNGIMKFHREHKLPMVVCERLVWEP